jgi:hypothetical protein
MFLDSDQLWFLGNLPTLQLFSKIYAQLLSRPAPLLEHFHTTRDTSLPTTIAEWKNAQLDDPAFLTDISPESLLLSDGLSLFKDPDFPSRILVPLLSARHSFDTTPTFNTFPTQKFLPPWLATTTGPP